MINGNPISDRIQLNLESLWSGGSFQNSSYNGGNHQPSEQGYLATQVARIRNTIFTSSNGTITGVRPLPADEIAFGTYSGAGYLNVNRTASGNVTNYARWLDMDNAVLKTTWTEPSSSFNRTYFCSNPSRACTVHTVSSTAGAFSAAFSFSSLDGLPQRNITCLDSSTIQLRGYAGSPGMLYEILGKIQQSGPADSTAGCVVDAKSRGAVLVAKRSTEAWVSWVGGTEYSMETGNAASGFTFKGEDPHLELVTLMAKASAQSVPNALAVHVADYHSALGSFSLSIGQEYDNTKTTAQLRKEYKTDVGNPFGSDNSAEWANYPEAAAWMMFHVYDHFDYTNDVAWWKAQGWPMIKAVASFWLDHLVEDEYFKDGTLVAVPCNSPEQPTTTLGCAHSQQVIWQLFNAIEKGFNASGDQDTAFLQEVSSDLIKGSRLVHLANFKVFLTGLPCKSNNQPTLEWKVEFDSPTNLHRHLSHLIGLYPGYALANFKPPTSQDQGIPKLTREQVLRASEISLISRGNGTGPDGDTGWEKVWRAACWAQLQNATRFYHQLTYAIERNFAENLWSLYNSFAEDPIFQIDANLGYPAAVLNALVQAPDTPSLFDALVVTFLPALPSAWGSGSIVGAHIRGGMTLDLTWSNGKAVRASLRVDSAVRYARQVQVWYGGKLVTSFSATAGLKRNLVF
ncbi:hypothetical protein FRC11_003910 [Ceratobasidium sp. 423]|nr:hypothetical protein FRC11_003910 [Ceratobasidium sp. 423]